jgi:predicted small lipoprotein YifL
VNWHRWLAALFVMLALAACAQGGQVPYPPENIHDRGGDGGGEGMM